MIAFSPPLLLKFMLLAATAVLGPAAYTTCMACRCSVMELHRLQTRLTMAWFGSVIVALFGFPLSWYVASWPLAILVVIAEYAAMVTAVALVSRRRKTCANI